MGTSNISSDMMRTPASKFAAPSRPRMSATKCVFVVSPARRALTTSRLIDAVKSATISITDCIALAAFAGEAPRKLCTALWKRSRAEVVAEERRTIRRDKKCCR
jgi:hypothetical protein